MTANFIYGSVVLANNKSDGDQTTSTAKVVADEWNTSVDALYDTKGAITDGEYYQLKDMTSAPPATAGAGKVRFVNLNGVQYVSSDGGPYRTLFEVFATQTASFTLGTDRFVSCDATSGAIVATLPTAAASNNGLSYVVYKSDVSTNTVTCNSVALAKQGEFVEVVSSGSAWVTVEQPASSSAPGYVTTGTQTLAGAKTFGSAITYASSASVTAHAGGGQGSATALTGEVNIVTTVASENDSVKLPTAAAGLSIVVTNRGAKPLDVYPASGGAIFPFATNGAYSLGVGETMTFNGQSSTQWNPAAPSGTAFYDIRAYGAIPGASGKTATTAAFNAIFAAISYSYFPTVEGKRAAVIYVPNGPDDSGWYIGDIDTYLGSTGASIYMKGDMPSPYSGVAGSTIIFDGTPGGTMFTFLAINASTFENLSFNGGEKAKVVIKMAQKWYGPPHNTQVSSNGVTFRNCFIYNPIGDYDSILVQAGSDDDPPNTMQAADYFFYNCIFHGHNAIQGWGFKTVVGGNTKNFIFDSCAFLYLYRGIETFSGYLTCRAIEGGNLGYDRDADAALVTVAAQSFTFENGGMENGGVGYFAKLINIPGQGTPSTISGAYFAGTCPADDYALGTSGKTVLTGCQFQNGRATSNAIPWAPSTQIRLGQQRLNDTDKWYTCITAGTTNSSGGPTGTGSDITDGSVHWRWSATGDANIAKISAGSTEVPSAPGSLVLECSDFAYNTTPIDAVPIYDGSGNPTTVSVGGVYDYARSVPHQIYCRGNRTGLFGGNIFTYLPDFDGTNVINARDQFYTNYITTGCTVLRNDSGVYVVTVPAAVVAATGLSNIRVGDMFAGMRVSEAIIDVTTLFSGPGVTGIEVSLGNSETTDDDILLSASIETVGQIGLVAADRGTGWEADRYIVAFDAADPRLFLTCSVSGGDIADINAGSLNVYLQFQRFKV